MKLISLPQFVFKYITWDKDYHKKIVLDNEIFFSSVRNFNDPFDSTIPLRYDAGTDEQIFSLFVKLIRSNDPRLNDDEVKRIARNEMRYNDVRDSQRIQNFFNLQRETIAGKFGIFSVSHSNENILMWSHYSNLHKGLCIRINCSKFRDFIENDCAREKLVIVWDNVLYEKLYPTLNPFNMNDYNLIMHPLLIKSEDWKYENELRFIAFDYSNGILKIPEGIIDQIILGCRMPESNRQEIIEYSNCRDLEILQASMKDNCFGLDFKKVNV